MTQPSQSSALRPECLVTLGLMPPVTLEDVKQAYLVRAREAHPDRGGSQEEFVRVQQAFEDATEFVKFKASKLEWLASKIDAYSQQQEVVTETIERGGSVEMEETDWLRKSFGDDFGHVADKLVAVTLNGPVADDVFCILLGFRADSLKDLARLDLAGGSLTDEGLLQLKAIKNLRRLDLRGTKVTSKLAGDIPGWFERLEFLGYKDSGMEGTAANHDPDCFWQADVEEAAERLASILQEEDASIVTIYDPIGGYRHPDHIQVHRVGKRAAELAGTPHVFESTMNREQMKSFADEPEWATMAEADNGRDPEEIEAERQDFLEQELGTPAAQITHAVDITPVIAEKKAAMITHASQITEDSVFLMLSDDAFARAFGQEWFVQHGATRTGAPYLPDLFAVLDDPTAN